MSVLLGPILSFRGIEGSNYNVSALLVLDLADAAPECVVTAGTVTQVQVIGAVPWLKPVWNVWRVDISVKLKAAKAQQQCTYALGGVAGSFYVPAKNAAPQMAYGSCNGFSSEKARQKVIDRPNERWFDLGATHLIKHYNLLIMGGDQVYSDELMVKDGPMHDWMSQSTSDRIAEPWSAELDTQVDGFFASLYITRWAQEGPHQVFQSIPTVMMWDDHDILDGWGSYPEALHTCPVYQNLYRIAARYFRLFQLQLKADESHPMAIPGAKSFSLGFQNLGNVALLVPDLRSERQPDMTVKGAFQPTQIVSVDSWRATYNWLDSVDPAKHKHLIVLSSVPVAYIDLNVAEQALNALPGQWELEDDLRDHWRSKPHQDERLRLIMRLLDFASRGTRVTIVSGDVHVAAACVIESRLPKHADRGAGVIFQLISTGIVHTPPPGMVVYFMETFGASPETVDHGVTAKMLPIGFKGHYLVPERNWLALEPDDKNRLWANWHVEGHPHLLTQVIDPIP